jgi:hypothetical protein
VPNDPNSQWMESMGASDPFGNALGNGGILYDLMSGADPLFSGEDAMLNIGTMADFASEGYSVLFHFQGDPADFWLPEMVGGSDFNPSDVLADQAVPEPSAWLLAIIGGFGLLVRRRIGQTAAG